MAIKRALVVDDSRSARMALRKLLEEHGLDVAEAASGELALEYLQRESVDVVFMDHTMPGMDGLEAVSAIKDNPATATIPVMMYTTREGEVYVGQARALGAVGVLPKNVQPHQLFEMLLNLGLVQDRRGSAVAQDGQSLDDVVDEVDRSLEQQALGMSVQALVTRILEDQHLTLRSDILRSQKSFARDVAREILKEQALQSQPDVVEDETASRTGSGQGAWWMSIVFVAAVVCGFLAWQFKSERDVAYQQLVNLEAQRSIAGQTQIADLEDALGGAEARSARVMEAALAGFSYAASLGSDGDMNEPAFSDELALRLQELLPHIEDLGFDGRITLTSHLGRFCLVVDELGGYQLAPEDLPMLECDYVGHVLEDNSYVSDRLDLEFARLLRLREGERPTLELVARDAGSSSVQVPYPGSGVTAGQWNEIARQNNRVEVSFSKP
jgi:CheY-like chemotaxis protein